MSRRDKRQAARQEAKGDVVSDEKESRGRVVEEVGGESVSGKTPERTVMNELLSGTYRGQGPAPRRGGNPRKQPRNANF